MADAGAQLFEELMRFRPDGLTANGWAVKAGVSRTIWSDLRRHGNPSRRTLEKLLVAAGSSLAEFEALRVGNAPPVGEPTANVTDAYSAGWHGAPLPPIPLIETRPGGEWGKTGSGIEMIELMLNTTRGHVPRPASMGGDREAYAVTILGTAMWPRFRQGRQLLVSPAAPVSIGDDVLVRLAGGGALIKELVQRPASFIELRQFNPDKRFRVDAAHITAVHKVMGEAF